MIKFRLIFVSLLFSIFPFELWSSDELPIISDKKTTEKKTLYNLSQPKQSAGEIKTIYSQPYSLTYSAKNWKRMWTNTAVLGGAFVGTLLVLQVLPEDATSWNRAEITEVPLFTRWYRNVVKKGPTWDHDKFYFNYILHPYSGAAYYMGARSCGFNCPESLLYSTLISTVCWEFGIEAFMERPSIQDLFITPLVGSAIGECFYKLKRKIVENGYTLWNSSFWGNAAAFLIDPINEVIGLFIGNPSRDYAKQGKRKAESSALPIFNSQFKGVSLVISF